MVTDVVGPKEQGSDIFGKVLTKDIVVSAIHHPKFARLRSDIAKQSLQKVSEAFTPADAQGICDMAGISTKSYRMLFNKVKEGFNSKLGKKNSNSLSQTISREQSSKYSQLGNGQTCWRALSHV